MGRSVYKLITEKVNVVSKIGLLSDSKSTFELCADTSVWALITFSLMTGHEFDSLTCISTSVHSLTIHLHTCVMPRSRMVELCVHSHIRLHVLVLN
jgi:hypothetical protein